MAKKKTPAFYAVHVGYKPGIYDTWAECEAQVKGYTGAKHKKFATKSEAEQFARSGNAEIIDLVAPGPSTSSKPSTGQKRGVAEEEGRSEDSHPRKKQKVLPESQPEGEGDLVVYTDGSCRGNGKAGSVAGIGVWWGNGDDRNLAERCPGEQTNNRAELIAIARLLESAPLDSERRLIIKTDSQYSIKCLTLWLHDWRKRNWKTASGGPVKNVAVIKYISTLLEHRILLGQKVDMKYVEGHAGIEGNEGADRLANFGASLSPVEERDWLTAEEEYREKIQTALENRQGDANDTLPQEAVVAVEAPAQKTKDPPDEEELAQFAEAWLDDEDLEKDLCS
ncbi:hypothetical protein AAF712_004529 [Marasmius tenuissimus]|uniref:ribonuclease H n=1 Tax=Marasmius tenuissimus TaxID=585030 RepID=A0ABR3A391_9AGAR